MLPKQNIPEDQKDSTWGRMTVYSIVTMCGSTYIKKMKDKFCYDLYHGIFNESDFDYLRKVDKYEYPAKIRFIPLLRPKADLLKSQETKRPFNFRVFTIDQLSISKKDDHKMNHYFSLIQQKLIAKKEMIVTAQSALQKVQQNIDQVRQSAAEQGQQLPPDLQMALEQAESQLRIAMSPLASEQILNSKEIEEVEKYYNYTYQDFIEIIAERGLKYMIYKHRIRDMFQHGFEDKICVDKEYYYCHYHNGDPDPTVRRVNPLNFYYSNDEESEWVGDCEWAMEERWMTIPQIVDEFKNDLSAEDMEKLQKKGMNGFYNTGYNSGRFSYYANTYQFGNPADYNTDGCNTSSLYAGTLDMSNKIRVAYVVWKSQREINFKKSPNKYIPDTEYTHWMSSTDRPKKDDKIVSKYVNDVWEGVMIDSDIYIRIRKMQHQLRSIDNYGKVDLPYVGIAHNNLNKKPYSLIWAAKDIQILYNLIHYHKELWLALSGVRGFIMDKSQMPDGMSPQEWLYQRKLGIGWIQSVREGLQRQPSYNQFQTFDDGVSPAIQYLNQILEHLDRLAGSVMGVSPQRQASIAPGDLKGPTEAAINQSELVTEIIYYQHDQTKRKVLERLINLCRIAWKDGKRGQYVIGSMAQEILNIPKDTINSAEYEVFMSDNGKEERLINEMRQMAAQANAKGQVSLSQMVKLFSMDNLAEIERTLERYGDMADKKAMENAQAANQMEAEREQAERDLKLMIAKWENELSTAQFNLDKERLDFERNKFAVETQLRNKEVDTNAYLQESNMMLDHDTEMRYLESENAQALMEYEVVKEQNRNDAVQTLTQKQSGGDNYKASNVKSSGKSTEVKKNVKDKAKSTK